MTTYRLIEGDCRASLRTLPAESIQTCVTSPPYFGLRDYGTARWEGGDTACAHVGAQQRTASAGTDKQASNAGSVAVFSGDCKCGARRIDSQIGLEPTPDAFVAQLVDVFREVRRVLKDDGTVWLNLGDSYANNGNQDSSKVGGFTGDRIRRGAKGIMDSRPRQIPVGLKPKDLIGIPWRVAFALQADGWYLRQDIIWHKPNPMPESVRDRCTKAHEYLFLLAKSERYYYDAEAITEQGSGRVPGNKIPQKIDASRNDGGRGGIFTAQQMPQITRNRRSVWTVPTSPYSGAHFATFPPALIEPCILAGSRVGDTVLDPFNGAATTGVVSIGHGRHYIGCELNPAYLDLSRERLRGVAPLLTAEVTA